MQTKYRNVFHLLQLGLWDQAMIMATETFESFVINFTDDGLIELNLAYFGGQKHRYCRSGPAGEWISM